MEYSINGRRSAFKKLPWFPMALKMQALMPIVPFPIIMRKAKAVWQKKHQEQQVSGLMGGLDVKSLLLGAALGAMVGKHIVGHKRSRR